MEEAGLATVERGIALGGALVVGTTALSALVNDWKTTGIDNQVTKIMLGLMTIGCVLVVLVAFKALGA
jgi:hypothetical protein